MKLNFYNKMTFEAESLNGWYGDKYTPVLWNVESLSNMTLHRMVHLHDITTGRCVKNREGVFCDG